MVTFILHHFMVDYKRVLCVAVDHGHLLLLKRPWIIWPESNALEGGAVRVNLPQIQTENVCPFLLPQNFTRLRWQAAPAYSCVSVCVCSLRKSLCFYQKDIEQL